MFKFVKFALFGWLLLHSVSSQIVDENLHKNATKVKGEKLPQGMQQSVDVLLEKASDPEKLEENNQLKLLPMPLLVDEQEAVVKSIEETRVKITPLNVEENNSFSTKISPTIADIPLHVTPEKEDTPHPLAPIESSQTTPSLNRTGRQLFYSPNFFYIQNIGVDGSKCITSRGLLGICMGFNNCIQQQHRRNRQLSFYSLTQLPYFTSHVSQQQEFCSYYDQLTRTSSGVCCTGINNVTPIQAGIQPMQPLQPEEQQPPIKFDEDGELKPAEDIIPHKDIESFEEDSDVLEPPPNFHNLQPEPPKYDNNEWHEANHIGYDPVDENLKQAQVFDNYMRYLWPPQFLGFSGVQQWPPPLPTHPPSADTWPPQSPTHPPNHHYPTHPPSSQAQFTPAPTTTTKRPITPVTTRRPPSYPSYPNYPTHRPLPITTTTTTTKRPFVSSDGGGGSSPAGLPLQCGTRNIGSPDQERIVGGTNASPHEFPWIAVLFKSGKQFCGGSLITNSHILTAAHCVARMTSWDVAALTIHLGDYNIRTDFEVQHVARRVKRLVRHKGFDFSILHNDVAVLTLSEPVKYTQEIQPICLPTSATEQTRSYSGHVATVAGWGSLRENGPQPSILQKVQIPIWTNSECAQKYGRAAPGGIIESMICAGQAAKDSCSGDSGGPLIINEGGRYVQVGIVSWGIGCGKGHYPGVYTRVTSLLPWIYKNLK